MTIKFSLLITILCLFAGAISGLAYFPPDKNVPTYSYKIINTYPHDPGAYTQGLVYADGFLYEGTGQNGESSLRKVDLTTGTVLNFHQLSSEYFGEGVAIYDDKIIQLTWQSNTGFHYDLESFLLIDQFYYPSEGWGLTYDGEKLIMSDGTENIYFLDPITFQEIGKIQVIDGDTPVKQLNELEYINGQVYANVWQSEKIVVFAPETGAVTAWIDLSGLLIDADKHPAIDTMNGIAYDQQNDRLFVTGKNWPKLFEVKLVPGK